MVMNILLTPARIGSVEIKNRIVMPPMTTRTADEEGFVTDDSIAYYMARVRGGTGLITVEMASPEKAGRHRRREVGIYDNRFVPGLTRLVDEIHRGGAKASIQLGHGGGHTRIDICGETPIAPSAIPHPVYETTFETIVPEAMTKARIAQDDRRLCRCRAACQGRRLRLRRNSRRARLSDLAISRAVREPPHRRVRRQPSQPRPLRPVRAARGEGEGAGHSGDLSALGRGLLSGRHAVRGRPAGRAVGGESRRRCAAHHRRPLSLPALGADRAAADEFSGRDLSAFCRRGEERCRGAGDRGRPARRSGHRARRGRGRQSGFHRAGQKPDRRSAMGREGRARRAGALLPRLQYLHQRDARRRPYRLSGQRRGRPRDPVCSRAAAARRTHRRDRRRTGRAHLRVAGRRRQSGHGL